MLKTVPLLLILILLIATLAAARVDAEVIVGVAVFFTAILIFILSAIIRAYRRRITTGKEGLIGQTAVAQTALDPKGIVSIEGERWNAWVGSGRIEPGEEVIVTKVEGLKLKVGRKYEAV
jgi:membrane-bound serine protease (ClpP class)